MQEDEQKSPVNRFDVACEIVFLVIMAIAIYVGGVLFLGKPIAHQMPWFFSPIGPFMILGFDIIWIIGMKLQKVKIVQIKIIKKILSVLVFSLSASLLTLWLILKLLSSIRW